MPYQRRRAPFAIAPLLVGIVLLAGGPRTGIRAQEEAPLRVSESDVPTNLGIAHELCSRVSGEILAALAAEVPGGCVWPHAGSEHAGNSLMELALASAARQQGLSVTSEASSCDAELEYRILELQIAYTGLDRSAFLVKQDIERTGTCIVAARLIETASGRELSSTQQEVILSDRFPKDMVELVSSKSYPFTSPELKTRDWSKSAEPFVVTALIAGLVYLFFSNQSSD